MDRCFPKGWKKRRKILKLLRRKLSPHADGANSLAVGHKNDDNHVINDNLDPIEGLLNISKRNKIYGTNETGSCDPDSVMTYSEPLSKSNASETNPIPKIIKILRMKTFHFEKMSVFI